MRRDLFPTGRRGLRICNKSMDGIINVYKEKGWTSFDVTKKLRAILHEKKIGHTGTLDPMAEGVLVVCAGTATKLVSSIEASEKVYEAEMKLGVMTDTEDTTGRILAEHPVELSAEEIRAAAENFIGSYDQVPPMYSAKKVNGQKLYDLARQGQVIERKPNRITIHALTVDSIALPYVHMTVTCSRGTYIRTLIKDIGEKLGCGAAMSALKRTRVGQFGLSDSRTIAEIAETEAQGRLLSVMKPPMYVPVPTVVSFGKFDGGHLGHQFLFEQMFRIAEEKKLHTAILTLTSNPKAVLTGVRQDAISGSEEHLTRLRSLGFDYVFPYPVNKDTMKMPAEEFLRTVLVEGMHASDIVVGTDCAFGYQAQGNAVLLQDLAARYGYTAHVIRKKEVLDENGREREISSTFIREEIGKGNVEKAAELLGRHVALSGIVQRGREIGAPLLGFPTANLQPKEGKLIPKEGVYVTRVLIGQKLYRGMTNIGTNPTVAEGNPVSVETYVFNYHGDLYGRKIRVEFFHRLRDQQKFASLEELKQQLTRDAEASTHYPMELGNV